LTLSGVDQFYTVMWITFVLTIAKRSVIITTNLDFSKWNGIFYNEKMTSAIIDRLIHHSHLLVFTGPSYRLTHSTMNC